MESNPEDEERKLQAELQALKTVRAELEMISRLTGTIAQDLETSRHNYSAISGSTKRLEEAIKVVRMDAIRKKKESSR